MMRRWLHAVLAALRITDPPADVVGAARNATQAATSAAHNLERTATGNLRRTQDARKARADRGIFVAADEAVRLIRERSRME